jgi:ABC-type amino acid transport substrate-binding protein
MKNVLLWVLVAGLFSVVLAPQIVFAQTIGPAASTEPSGTAADGVVKFPTFGVSLTQPAGYVRVPEGGAGHIIRWAKIKDGVVTAMIVAESEPAKGRTLAERAKRMATEMSGAIDAQDAALGGMLATAIEVSSDSKALHPARAVLTLKGKYFYVLSIFVVGNGSWKSDFDPVLKSWTWMKLESVGAHLRLRDQSYPFFNVFTMTPADLLRPFPIEKGRMYLGMYDYIRGDHKYMLTIEPIGLAAGVERDTILKNLGDSFVKQAKLKSSPQWTKLDAKMDVYLTGTLDASFGDRPPATLVVGVLFVSPKQAVVFTASIFPDTAQEKEAFVDITRKMFSSIAPATVQAK